MLVVKGGVWTCGNPLPSNNCGENQFTTWQNGALTCATAGVGSTGPTGAPGSTGATGAAGAAGTALPSCSVAGQYLTSSGAAGTLTCTGPLPASATSVPPSACAFGSVSRWDGMRWNCDSLALETYPCPPGYTAASDAVSPFCMKTVSGSANPDEMVKVGDFWIDRFEMSQCSSGGAGATAGTGYGTTAVGCSVAGVQPATSITWFQAAQMCANAGKALCTNAQWQTAASGTVDPGAYPETNDSMCLTVAAPGTGPCNTCSDGARLTGLGAAGSPGAGCYSSYGAEDMIGNVWEWTAEWWEAGNDGAWTEEATAWPAGYGDCDGGNACDATWNVNGSAESSTTFVDGMPGVALRGGNFSSGVAAGAFALNALQAPAYSQSSVGARCCAEGR